MGMKGAGRKAHKSVGWASIGMRGAGCKGGIRTPASSWACAAKGCTGHRSTGRASMGMHEEGRAYVGVREKAAQGTGHRSIGRASMGMRRALHEALVSMQGYTHHCEEGKHGCEVAACLHVLGYAELPGCTQLAGAWGGHTWA
eukprot:524254-Pelagomonas_calceolata.AAC.1